MIDRINKNEERFDKVLDSVNKMNEALSSYESIKKDLKQLIKYYESKNWIKDKDTYESGSIKKIKAGVLSEDGVWNMLSDISELMKRMEKIVEDYNE